jgi:hypothetical protein
MSSEDSAPGPALESLDPPPAQEEMLSLPVESLDRPSDIYESGEQEPVLSMPVDALTPPSEMVMMMTTLPVEALDGGGGGSEVKEEEEEEEPTLDEGTTTLENEPAAAE